jgi:cytochrome c peroxidase
MWRGSTSTFRCSVAVALVVLVAVGAFALVRNGASREDSWTTAELSTLRSLSLRSFAVPPDPSNRYADDPRAAALGRALFFDAELSANGEVSCSGCHQPEKGFQDGLPLGRGLATVNRRTMPIAGAAAQQWFFWDGRKDSLWSQALGPLENPREHGLTRLAVVRFVARRYRRQYEAIFGPLTVRSRRDVNHAFANVGKTIAAYERRLRFAPARFDRYVDAALAGDQQRMRELVTAQEVEGLRLYLGEAHCLDCHNGPLFSNGEFHNTGVPPRRARRPDVGRIAALAQLRRDEFNCVGEFSDAKPGDCAMSFLVTESARLRGAFKPPSLRNATRRAPYMHAGQIATLADVLDHYNRAPRARVGRTELHPLGFNREQLDALAAFLRTLETPIVGTRA